MPTIWLLPTFEFIWEKIKFYFVVCRERSLSHNLWSGGWFCMSLLGRQLWKTRCLQDLWSCKVSSSVSWCDCSHYVCGIYCWRNCLVQGTIDAVSRRQQYPCHFRGWTKGSWNWISSLTNWMPYIWWAFMSSPKGT